MPKFRKKPIVIEAIQFTGTKENLEELSRFSHVIIYSPASTRISIKTLEGMMEATKGDWIIKGVADEFYPCKPDIFEATYEAVED